MAACLEKACSKFNLLNFPSPALVGIAPFPSLIFFTQLSLIFFLNIF